MSELSDCKPASGSELAVLPTRQKNALRLLLDKPCFTPRGGCRDQLSRP